MQTLNGARKAIVGVLTPCISWAVMHYGLDIDAEMQAAIVTVLTGLLVYLVPNE